MAARTKTVITTEARATVLPYHVEIKSGDSPGDVNLPGATTPTMCFIILLLLILEVLLNIRQGESA